MNHKPLRQKGAGAYSAILARLEGLEPPTPGSEVQRSLQLSYRRSRKNYYTCVDRVFQIRKLRL